MEDALYLSHLASKVTMIHRRQQFRSSKIMLNRVKNNPKIDLILDSVIEEYLGETQNNFNTLTGVKIRNVKTNEITEHKVDGVFLAVGHIPNTHIFKGILDMNSEGYLVTKGKGQSSYTNIAGVFACGDVQDSIYRQAITAAGSGCRAGIDAER
jgi:thioredoxin reductase (NADPH)